MERIALYLNGYVRTSVLALSMVLTLVMVAGSAAHAGSKSRVVELKVHGQSLEGNLEGESADRDVLVYLPPSYDEDPTRRYPVVYLLHDYLLTNRYWVGEGLKHIIPGIDLPAAMDRDIASGTAREMILVMPDAKTKYGGSLYSSSVTIGDWETYIAEDLVKYIDGHFRTLAQENSRGLAGHSMGGYGTIRIAMKRPGVFSSIYIMSACCLINNPAFFRRYVDRGGEGSDGASEERPRSGGRDANERGRDADGHSDGQPDGDHRRYSGPPIGDVIRAEAAAWSPDPQNPPHYFDLPDENGGLVVAKWAANSPLAMIDQYIPALRGYSAIGMDIGTRDGFRRSNEKLAAALSAYGIHHTFEVYDGNHVDQVGQRMEKTVIPFFSKHLDFAKQP